MKNCYRIIITAGEPAGIGPDLVLQLSKFSWPCELVICADRQLLHYRAIQLGMSLNFFEYQPNIPAKPQQPGAITILHIDTVEHVIAGKLSMANSSYVLNTLIRACDGCKQGEFAALVTGPIHKGIINDAGIKNFIGHTEFFATRTKTSHVVMMLATEELRVALVTTHLPLKKVVASITRKNLSEVINVLHYDMQYKFNLPNPHIFVCGLNPHAGEKGYIGKEEIEIIMPVLNELRQKGIRLTGPLPADTVFQPKYLKYADVILAMYHDQGLPVLKYHGFGRAVNITLGLPFIRTSVDHGTAIELAGLGKANSGSFLAAINLAIIMVHNING